MLALPDSRGEFTGAFEAAGSVAAGSAPAKPPDDPAEGRENWRVAAFVIMRSGGARAGAALALAGEGSALGAEPKGLTRLSQPGPEELLGAGRLLAN